MDILCTIVLWNVYYIMIKMLAVFFYAYFSFNSYQEHFIKRY